MSSGRLFRSECFSAFRMCSFSVRQRLHHLDSLLYDCALLAIDQLMVNGFLFLWSIYITGVGSGGGGGARGACAPLPLFLLGGGNGMFVSPPPTHTHTFNPTFLFST